MGTTPSLALLSRNIIERAQGNPFFLEELINALVERGDFEGEKGAYRLKGGIDAIPLPSTVQAVIAARIDRLEENAKKVLEIASVVGREISISILDLVTGLTPTELSEAIQHLRQAELLYDVPSFRTAASCISSSTYPGGCLSIVTTRTSPRTSFKSGAGD